MTLIFLGIIVLLNIWVWFFANSFIHYLKIGKNAKIETLIPSQKEVWKLIENPHYIWYPRIVFGAALFVMLVMQILANR